jgi:DNA polymerase-3 subunit epsilon
MLSCELEVEDHFFSSVIDIKQESIFQRKPLHIYGQNTATSLLNLAMKFVTIDFETATADRDSACEVGLAFVEDGQVRETKSWLVKPPSYPYFDPFNISIHGIYPADVANQPTWAELWPEVRPLLEGQLVIAHNAGFDFSVLRRTLEAYQLPFPTLQYACSYIFSKKIWTGLPAYDLKSLCRFHGISLQHHRAASDAQACAELTLKTFSHAGITSSDDFAEKLLTSIGHLHADGYRPCVTRRIYPAKDPSLIKGDPTKHKPDSLFYGRSVVFTGTLSSMQRAVAQQVVADLGGINSNGVTKETAFLVVGQQDYRVVGEVGWSSKNGQCTKIS